MRYDVAGLLLVCLAWTHAGCSDSEDDKTVGGRTQSLSKVAPTSSSALARLQFLEERTQATGQVSRRLAFRLEAEVSAGVLRRPDGGEQPLERQLDGTWGLEGPLAGDPHGAYTVLWREADGAAGSITLLAEGAWPAYPEVVSPPDAGLVRGDGLTLRWTWPGAGGAFDVEVRALPIDVERFSAEGLTAQEARLPTLPTGRYRARVCARTAANGPVAWTRASVITFDVE